MSTVAPAFVNRKPTDLADSHILIGNDIFLTLLIRISLTMFVTSYINEATR